MATGSKWKQSTVNVGSIQEKLDARNKVIELKAKYEGLAPRLVESVNELFQFLIKKPEVSKKYDFSHFSTVKDAKIAEATEGFYKSQFTSLPKLQQDKLKLLYLFDMEKDIVALNNQVKSNVDSLKSLVRDNNIKESILIIYTPKSRGAVSKTFKLPDTYKAYFDWFKEEAWALRDTKEESVANKDIKEILGAEIKYTFYSPNYGYHALKTDVQADATINATMNQDHVSTTDYIEMQHVVSALEAVEKMHETYEEILTLAEDMDTSTQVQEDTKEATATFMEKVSSFFGGFFTKSKPKTAEPKQTGSDDSVKDEAEKSWDWSYLFKSSPKKKVEAKTENVDEDESFDTESSQVSTNVVEYSVDSVETQTTIHSRYQLYVSKFLETAKLHCFGKVIASQLLLANCQAYRLSSGKKDIECKNIETMVKIFTDHCQYAFPFETAVDEHINTELLEAVKIKAKVRADGQLEFSGAGQEYASGFIVDSSKTDAEGILGTYMKYVPERINDETEVLALPSGTTTTYAAVTDGNA